MPDDIGETYDRLFKALEQLLREAQRVGDNGVREWASLAMLDAIDFAEAMGMMWKTRRHSAGRPSGRRLRTWIGGSPEHADDRLTCSVGYMMSIPRSRRICACLRSTSAACNLAVDVTDEVSLGLGWHHDE